MLRRRQLLWADITGVTAALIIITVITVVITVTATIAVNGDRELS